MGSTNLQGFKHGCPGSTVRVRSKASRRHRRSLASLPVAEKTTPEKQTARTHTRRGPEGGRPPDRHTAHADDRAHSIPFDGKDATAAHTIAREGDQRRGEEVKHNEGRKRTKTRGREKPKPLKRESTDNCRPRSACTQNGGRRKIVC